MEIKKSKRLLNELAIHTETPKEFIYSIMALQNQSAKALAEDMSITQEHFYVLMNSLVKGGSFIPKTCIDLANALDIDPYVLNTVVQNYRLKVYLKTQNSNVTEGED